MEPQLPLYEWTDDGDAEDMETSQGEDDDLDILAAKKRDAPVDGRGHVAQQVNLLENMAVPQ